MSETTRRGFFGLLAAAFPGWRFWRTRTAESPFDAPVYEHKDYNCTLFVTSDGQWYRLDATGDPMQPPSRHRV
jgi:hypothetical protein